MSDGLNLKADWHYNKKNNLNAVVLHQCNKTRKDFSDLSELLFENGINVLNVDQRGYGDSVNSKYNIASSSRMTSEERLAIYPQLPADSALVMESFLQLDGVKRDNSVLLWCELWGNHELDKCITLRYSQSCATFTRRFS